MSTALQAPTPQLLQEAVVIKVATEGETTFHLKCRLCLHTMLMGNRLPMVLPAGLSPSPSPLAAASSGANGPSIVDAHNVQGIDMPTAVKGVSQAMHVAMDQEELLLRRFIGHKIVLSMGRMMTHFEGEVDPKTGVLEVDHVFKPLIVSKEDEHLMGQHAYDPHSPEMKVKDCIAMRVYCSHIDDETKEVYSYPIAHEAIDLYSLQLRSIQVSGGVYVSRTLFR